MSSPPPVGPESVEWEALEGDRLAASRRTLVFVAAVLSFAGAYGYVEFLRVSDAPPLGLWNPSGYDLLLAVGVAAVACYVAWPLVVDRARARRYWRRLRADPAGVAALGFLAAFVLVGTVGPALVGPRQVSLYDQYQPPVFVESHVSVTRECVGPMVGEFCQGTWNYPLGTDSTGLGVVWLVVKGTRVALLVALVAALVIAPLATGVGVVAGYYGGRVDELLMRYVDVQESIPAIVVYFFLAAIVGESLWLLLVAFGLLSWGGIARLVRSETLQRREEGYVRAARSAGASRWTVAVRHLVPNVASTALTATTQLVPRLVLTEAAASFLYLTPPNLHSWGVTLAQGFSGKYATFPPTRSIRDASMLPTFWEKWWTAAFVTLALLVTVVAFSVFGDALRDVLDPRTGVAGEDGS